MSAAPDREPEVDTQQSQLRTIDADLVLMAHVAEGDASAQKQLVLRLSGRLMSVVRAILGRDADAEDALQLTLMRVLGAADAYRGDGSVERWAERIAVRTAISEARRQRRRTGSSVHDSDAPAPSMRQDPALHRDLSEHLDRLPEDIRVLIVLRHAYEYTVPELAEATETSINTVKKRLIRANKMVRQLVRRDQLKLAGGSND